MIKVLIYCHNTAPRLEYTLDLLFRGLLQLDYQLVHNADSFKNSDQPKINYSAQRLSQEEVFIPQHQLLFESGVSPQQISVFEHLQLKAFFAIPSPNADLPFDLFSMIFYLVSRYEEYTSLAQDQHGRFPAGASLAYKNQFLQQPLINQWAFILLDLLSSRFANIKKPDAKFHVSVTYDIDIAWAYLHRPWWRQMGSAGRSLINGKFQEIKHRLAVQSGQAPDPYFSFAYLETLHKKHQLQPKFFFLLGDYGPFDKNISPANPALQQLILRLASEAECIGIHPSYQSNQSPAQLKKEIQRLEYILGKAVVHSRQHYLKLQLPTTYQRLIDAGICHDYSMGYASAIGFRASVATPFYWYNLSKEQTTKLKIHPFQVMDVTLKEYLKLTPEEVLDFLQPIIRSCREIGGQFCTLWHNSSFSYLDNWDNWKPVYEMLLVQLIRESIQ